MWLTSFITQICLRKCHEANWNAGKNPGAGVGPTDLNERYNCVVTADLPIVLLVSEHDWPIHHLLKEMAAVSNIL